MANWGLTRKQIIMLIVLVFGTFVTVLNQTVVAPALPSIMSEMSVDAAVAQWLTTGFTLVNAIMVPITAFLTDRFTTRRLFLASMVLFTAGTALAAWGPNFPVLLAGRLVQAAGAGILMPLVMTVLMWTFPVDRRGTAMGVFGIVIAFAPAAGPTVAGIIMAHKDETPGLGAEIATPKYQANFVGKTIFDGDKFVSVTLRKGGAKDPAHEVDAISGGTKTSDGVTAMLYNSLENYLPLLEAKRNAAAPAPAEVSNEENVENNE